MAAYLRQLKIKLVTTKVKNPVRGQLTDPKALVKIFKDLKNEAKETLLGVYLRDNLEVNSYEVLSIGDASGTMVSTDEIFRGAILTNSPFIVLIHNHPSGRSEPSDADKHVMAVLTQQSLIMNRHFLDFIVIGDGTFWSMFDELGGGEYSADTSIS